MGLYKIIVYELIVFKVQQKNRTIEKKYFKEIEVIKDIPLKELAKKMIELKQSKYKDFKYILVDLGANESNWYIQSLNAKSEKAYFQRIRKVLDQ